MSIRILSTRCALLIGLLTYPTISGAETLRTTDPAAAAAFMSGGQTETFDALSAHTASSYDPGQTLPSAAEFSSRDGNTAPTFHSGGASFNDPVGNPGTPIVIIEPAGDIASDVSSAHNVAAGMNLNQPDEPFNGAFIEVIFPKLASRVGLWVTQGETILTLFDSENTPLTGGSAHVAGSKGEFIGLDRGIGEIRVASLIPTNGSSPVTIDDFSWFEGAPIGKPNQRLAYIDHIKNDVDGVIDLDNPQAITTSPDGKNVYALAQRDDALLVFERNNSTGRLGFTESIRDREAGVSGIKNGLNIAVSPDNRNVYVTSGFDELTTFRRSTTDGTLTFLETFKEGKGGVTGIGSPFDLEMSPDGEFIYVAGHNSQAVAIFDRDPENGRLQFVSAQTQGIIDLKVIPDHLCMSPDGKQLYVASFSNEMAVFARNAKTGLLRFVELEPFSGATSDCGVSSDGQFIYAPGRLQTGKGTPISIRVRDSATGKLSDAGNDDAVAVFSTSFYLPAAGLRIGTGHRMHSLEH